MGHIRKYKTDSHWGYRCGKGNAFARLVFSGHSHADLGAVITPHTDLLFLARRSTWGEVILLWCTPFRTPLAMCSTLYCNALLEALSLDRTGAAAQSHSGRLPLASWAMALVRTSLCLNLYADFLPRKNVSMKTRSCVSPSLPQCHAHETSHVNIISRERVYS